MRNFLLAAITMASLSAQAATPRCDIESLKGLNDTMVSVLICASMPDERLADCLQKLARYGGFVMLMGSNKLESAPPSFKKLEAKMPSSTRTMVREYYSRGTFHRWKVGPQLVAELQKHPRLFHHQILGLKKWLWTSKAHHIAGATGLAAVLGSFAVNLFLTSSDECQQLTFAGIDPRDNKWIDFGLNCSKYVNKKFFALEIEEQAQILERSPRLCQQVTQYQHLLDAIYPQAIEMKAQ